MRNIPLLKANSAIQRRRDIPTGELEQQKSLRQFITYLAGSKENGKGSELSLDAIVNNKEATAKNSIISHAAINYGYERLVRSGRAVSAN